MESLIQFLKMHPFAVAALAFGWIASVVLVSVVLRYRNGKPLLPKRPEGALFFEDRASGHSNRSFISRFGGAHGCLHVAVTPDQLHITPRFPFNLMHMPEHLRVELSIKRSDVREVSISPARWVTVEWQQPGPLGSVSLRLKDPEAFVALLQGS